MSVWTDIGIIDGGTFFGVLPERFLTQAYGFFRFLRSKLLDKWNQMPEYDFSAHAKTGDHDDFWTYDIAGYLSFLPYYRYNMYPVLEKYLSTPPDWTLIFRQTEESLLGEPVIPCPYAYGRCSIMDPGWWKQRYKIIQQMRYVIVPLDITLRTYDTVGNPVYRKEERLDFSTEYWWSTLFWGTYQSHPSNNAWYDQIDITFPDYWKLATTRKIGLQGQIGRPIEIYWKDTSFNYTFVGPGQPYQSLAGYGVVDLATHPDFAQYFDIENS